jgi:hypothetical protein
MKIKKWNELNEGMRINPKIFKLVGEYTIDEVIDSLQRIYDKGDVYAIIDIFSIDFKIDDPVIIEMNHILEELKNWKQNGASTVKGEGSEWYPLWD